MSATDDRKARLLAAVQRVPSPTRDEARARDRTWLLAAVLAVSLVFVAIGGVHAGQRPPGLVVASGVLWGAIAALVTGLALWRGRSMLGAPRGWLIAGAIAVAPVLALSWLCLPVPAPSAPHAFTADGACFAITLALGAGPLLVLLRLRGEGDPVRPGATGAALAAAAGAWGAALIDLHCDRLDPVHVLVGHVGPVVLLALGGAAWGTLGLRVREP